MRENDTCYRRARRLSCRKARRLHSSLPLLLLLGQNDEDANEDVQRIDEQVDRVPDEVIVAMATLLDDELRVEQHEAAEEQQSAVQLRVEESCTAREDVDEAQQHEYAHTREEHRAQEEEFAAFAQCCTQRQTDEHHACQEEGRWNQVRRHGRCQSQQWAQRRAHQECETTKQSETLAQVLSCMLRQAQTKQAADRSQTRQKSALHSQCSLLQFIALVTPLPLLLLVHGS